MNLPQPRQLPTGAPRFRTGMPAKRGLSQMVKMADGGQPPSFWTRMLTGATGYDRDSGDLHPFGTAAGIAGLINPFAGLLVRGLQYGAGQLGYDPTIHIGGGRASGPDLGSGPPTEFIPSAGDPQALNNEARDDAHTITVTARRQNDSGGDDHPQGWSPDPFNHGSDAAYYGELQADQLRNLGTNLQDFYDNWRFDPTGLPGAGEASGVPPQYAAPPQGVIGPQAGAPTQAAPPQMTMPMPMNEPPGGQVSTRRPMTPFRGDYRHYGQGPGWNFYQQMAAGGSVGGLTMAGGGDPVQQLRSRSVGNDTELAHFSPGELQVLDYFNNGQRNINPGTGLPQYSFLGKLLKGLVRAGAAIAGAEFGGPLGGAAGAALGTKITGGSWKDSLNSAAYSGIGGELSQGLSGGGWNPTGGNLPFNPGEMTFDMGNGPFKSGEGLPTGPQSFTDFARSGPGLAAGLGSLVNLDGSQQPIKPTTAAQIPPFSVKPMVRKANPYSGDFTKYGFGPGHRWYEVSNPAPQFGPSVPGGVDYSDGYAQGGAPHAGPVRGPGGGQDDLIPAQLSNGEHVITAREISALGDGDNETGQKRMYGLRRQILQKAGYKNTNPKKQTKPVRGLGNFKLVPGVAA